MTEASRNDPSLRGTAVLLALFVVLVGLGIATVAVPEVGGADPDATRADGGVDTR